MGAHAAWLARGAMLVALAACTDRLCPDATDAGGSVTAKASEAPNRIRIKNFCYANAETLRAYAAVLVHDETLPDGDEYLGWRIECQASTGACDVTRIDLGAIERGSLRSFLTVYEWKTVRVSSWTSRRVVLATPASQVGTPWFTIDLEKKRFDFDSMPALRLGRAHGSAECGPDV
jgi:hypothetical protein